MENLHEKDTQELYNLLEFFEKRHKETRKANKTDSSKWLDEKLKDYCEKIGQIENELRERGEF